MNKTLNIKHSRKREVVYESPTKADFIELSRAVNHGDALVIRTETGGDPTYIALYKTEAIHLAMGILKMAMELDERKQS